MKIKTSFKIRYWYPVIGIYWLLMDRDSLETNTGLMALVYQLAWWTVMLVLAFLKDPS